MAKPLRAWRTEQLLSLRDLADAAQITTQTLTDLEYGRRRASERTIRQVSAALGVDADSTSSSLPLPWPAGPRCPPRTRRRRRLKHRTGSRSA